MKNIITDVSTWVKKMAKKKGKIVTQEALAVQYWDEDSSRWQDEVILFIDDGKKGEEVWKSHLDWLGVYVDADGDIWEDETAYNSWYDSDDEDAPLDGMWNLSYESCEVLTDVDQINEVQEILDENSASECEYMGVKIRYFAVNGSSDYEFIVI